jgi:protein involved in polysaccharide export with SLBB domain
MLGIRRLSVSLLLGLLAFWFGQLVSKRAGAETGGETEWRIQPGDELKIQVMNLPELAADVRVRPDGMISVMLLDDIPAAGRTVTELRKEIAAGYAKHYRDPKVAVFPMEIKNRTVYVTGEVNRPGAVALTPGLSAMRAVIEAGGLKPNSKVDEAVVLRHGEGADRKVVPLHLQAVLKGSEADPVLEPADIVYIPKSDIQVYVGGEVQKPGIIPLDSELTAFRAVTAAGGFLETANPNKAVVIRNSGGEKPEILEVRLGDVRRGGADLALKPYDIVFVPKSGIAKIDQVSELFLKRLIPMTLTGGFSYVLGGFSSGINCFQ